MVSVFPPYGSHFLCLVALGVPREAHSILFLLRYRGAASAGGSWFHGSDCKRFWEVSACGDLLWRRNPRIQL
ncbi:MAG: hypothetical protein ACKN94_04505, partial [Pirellulaceae bacterium]